MRKYFFDPETLLYRVKEDNVHLKRVRLALLVLAVPFIACLYVWLYVSVFDFDLPKTAHLKRRHAEWEARLDLLDKQMDVYEQTLSGIEQRDDDVYRSIYGLAPIPEQMKSSGTVDAGRYDELDGLAANSRLRQSVYRLDNLAKRTYVRSKALAEVWELSQQDGDMMSCVPNIPPLMTSPGNFRISSGFGHREDPVYGGSERHGGQDFAAARGTAVYVTGDGVVEKTNFQFRGYGNEIVVDHGYGYKTRYAHLNTIEVTEGMKVSRGDRIGSVGNTGKSTGYHLHYEVMYRGEKKNPRNYMDLDMSVSEFAAIINRRGSDPGEGARMSTMDLLRRSRKAYE